MAFDTRMGGAETAIQKLKNNLAGLQKLVEEKLKSGADAEEVKELVLAELAKFRDEVNDRFLVAEKKIILLKTSLERAPEDLKNLLPSHQAPKQSEHRYCC